MKLKKLATVVAAMMVVSLAPVGPASGETGSADAVADSDRVVVRDTSITMSDGVVLKADEYLPKAGCPCTPVLTFTPYSKNDNTGASRLDPKVYPDLTRNGYAQIVVDVRGTGASGGTWGIFSPREQKDYAEMVRWAAKRPYGDGQVLARGDSYAAIAALLAAEQPGTEALKAMFIEVASGDQYRDILTAGGNPNTQFLAIWAYALVTVPSLLAPLADGGPNLAALQDHVSGALGTTIPTTLELLLGDDSSSLPKALRAAGAWDGPWYRERSPLTNAHRIKSAVMMVGGQNDIFQRTQPMLYEALRLPAARKKLLLTGGYHATASQALGTTDTAGNTILARDELANAWFDRWARGKRNGVDKLPTRETFFRGVSAFLPSGTDGPAAVPLSWHLDGTHSGTATSLFDGSLTSGRTRKGGSASVPFMPLAGVCSHNPTQYLFGAVPENACSQDERLNDLQAATFTSPPVTSPQALNGPMNLRVWAKTTGHDANVVAKVEDVAPDGKAQQLSFGSLFASNRAVVAAPCKGGRGYDCSLYDSAGGLLRPFHPFTKAAQQAVVPGKPVAMDVEIAPFAAVLKRGHRLRVSLLTGDFPTTTPTTALLADALGSTVTFLFDSKHRSYLHGTVLTGPDRKALLR